MRSLTACPKVVLTVFGLFFAFSTVTAQPLGVSPAGVNFTATADSLNFLVPQLIGIVAEDGSHVQFQFDVIVQDGGPNFLVVSPSSGTTPSTVAVALNPNVVGYLPSGVYVVALHFGVVGQSSPPNSAIFVTLRLIATAAPAISAVVGAANLQAPISPGELVSIFGDRLGTPPQTAQYDFTGFYPTDLSHRKYQGTARDGVTFNGIPAPLLFESTTQINAIVPYGVAGQKTVSVVVTHNLQPSPAFSVPLADTSPGIFTATQNGKGQGAILNTNGTPNSADNPAAKGSVIQIFATGAGLWNKPLPDGGIQLDAPFPVPAAAVSVTIGDKPAKLNYAAAAPYEVSGMLQVNAIVPDGIGSGPQQVVLTIGTNDNSQQQATVAVQ
jgi:uncharacterized protein (TIGR03437 family)